MFWIRLNKMWRWTLIMNSSSFSKYTSLEEHAVPLSPLMPNPWGPSSPRGPAGPSRPLNPWGPSGPWSPAGEIEKTGFNPKLLHMGALKDQDWNTVKSYLMFCQHKGSSPYHHFLSVLLVPHVLVVQIGQEHLDGKGQSSHFARGSSISTVCVV